MTRGRLWAAIAVVGGLLAGAAAAPSYAAGVDISPGGGPAFPARALVLTAPGRTIQSGHVHVRENGAPIPGVVVTPLTRARRGDYGVVLLVDTSGSMKGTPIARAMDAARALAGGLTGGQEISVIEFDQRTHVVLPLTSDRKAIGRALAGTPHVGGGTHVFDAVATAQHELLASHVAVGSIIVVSDGGDRGSRISAAAATQLGAQAHYTVYSVGVRDRYFDSGVLRQLAKLGGGAFTAASTSQLHGTLTALQARLSSRYLVHYRSFAGFGEHVNVWVTVDGVAGAATLAYQAPSPPGAHAPKTFWTSNTALLVFGLIAAVLLVLGILSLLASRSRDDEVRARIARFTDERPPAIVAGPSASPAAAQSRSPELFARAEQTLERRSSRWRQLVEDLDIARVETSPRQLLALTIAGTVAVAVMVAVASGVPALGLVVLPLGPLVLSTVVKSRVKRQRRLFADALPSHLQEIASAMRAGHSVVSALGVTTEGAGEPVRTELRRVVADEQLGRPLDVALAPVAQRMACPDIQQLALVASMHERSGGNLAEVLDRLAEAMRDRAALRRELQSLTAQARLSRYIVTVLPVAVLVLLSAINPTYVSPLFHTSGGVILLIVSGAMIIAAYFVMSKIVEIEV